MAIGEKGGKVVAGGLHLPGCGSVVVNSVLVLTKEKWVGRDHKFLVRVVMRALVQVEVHSPAITLSSGDAMRDRQFGYDCELTDDEWSLFCGVFFRDPSITKDEAGVRTALRKIDLATR